jgi:NHLM bacteriocin system ABC transporter ATP-binding protein
MTAWDAVKGGLSADRSDDELAFEADELFLLKLRYKLGRLIRSGSSRPVLLDDPGTVWVVYVGWVDVFAVPSERGDVSGVRRHLFRAEAGQAIFGVDAADDGPGITLLAVGGPRTKLVRLERFGLEALAQEHPVDVASMIDAWIIVLSSAIAAALPPKESKSVEPTGELSLEEGEAVYPRRGVLWVSHLEGRSRWMGLPELPPTGSGSLLSGLQPLSRQTWLEASERSRLRLIDTEALIQEEPSWSSLDRFNELALDRVARRVAQVARAETERLRAKAEAERLMAESALSNLASVLEPASAVPRRFFMGEGVDVDPLLAACQLVGQALGLTVRAHPGAGGSDDPEDALREIARASRFRVRRVTLEGEWWHADRGPLLGYREGDMRPVALLPTSPRRYELIDPLAGTRTPVTPEVAASLSPVAYVLYRPFPERALSLPDLFRFGLRGSERELFSIALAGVAIGVLGLVTPLMIGLLFDSVIPGAQQGQLLQVGLALLVSAIAAALFRLTQNVAVLRLAGKLDLTLQTAVWDRLLRLPVRFFRRYSAGDLAERAMGIDIIRRKLPETVISSILVGVFSIFNFALLFYLDARLAWVAVGLALLFVLATAVAGYLQVRHQRELTELQGRISGTILQLMTGIAKLRVAGAEERAFALWARKFSEQRRTAMKARSVANAISAFHAAYPVLTSIGVFAMVAWASESGLSTGDFLAFSAAFTQFLAAGLTVSSTLTSLLTVVPVYERLRPILRARPEVDEAKSDPGELAGEIEVSHVVFRYRESEPLVLKDVSFHVEPGEFVALVGPSGCGKSTLIRLLLGFEAPSSGAIYYDGQDLGGLDVEAVRRQLGVVLQDGQLISGDIYTNVVGSLPLTIEDAWDAARMVGLDEDIEHMPMGMHTVIGERGSTLSGGQRQRLLIARAIVNKPRILFFDEATSALDNRTQAMVSESLEGLHVTRIVVAHRLSTIAGADRIFVLDDGEIVQSGTYEELMRQSGLFARLAKRQLT